MKNKAGESVPPATQRSLRIANVVILISLCGFVYFDQPILGVGICFCAIGVLSLAAFAWKAEPFFAGYRNKVIFDWLFEHYSSRALNLFVAIVMLTVGGMALVHIIQN